MEKQLVTHLGDIVCIKLLWWKTSNDDDKMAKLGEKILYFSD